MRLPSTSAVNLFSLATLLILVSCSWAQTSGPNAKESHTTTNSSLVAWLNHPDDQAMNPLLKALTEGTPDEKFEGAWALGQVKALDNHTITDRLLRAISKSDLWLHTQILETLRTREETKANERLENDSRVLAQFLRDAEHVDPFVRAEAIKGLRFWKIEPNVIAALRRAARDPVWLVQHSALVTSSLDMETLKAVIHDIDPRIRLLAVQQLSTHRSDPQARDILIERLRDPNRDVVIEAASILSQWKEKTAVKPILDLLNLKFYGAVVPSIFKITGSADVDQVMKEYDWKPDPNFKADAEVNKLTKAELDRLIKKITQADQAQKLEAIFLLIGTDDFSRIKPVFQKLAGDPDDRIRFAVLSNLEFRSNVLQGVDGLELSRTIAIQLLSDTNFHIRVLAIRTATWPKDPPLSIETRKVLSETLLKSIEPSENPFVREAAIPRLGVAADGEKLQQLWFGLANDEFAQVRKSAIFFADPIAFPDGLNTSLKAMKDPVSSVRLTAVKKFQGVNYLTAYSTNTNVIKMLQAVSLNDSELAVREAAQAVLSAMQQLRK